jgi:hypothetical protein
MKSFLCIIYKAFGISYQYTALYVNVDASLWWPCKSIFAYGSVLVEIIVCKVRIPWSQCDRGIGFRGFNSFNETTRSVSAVSIEYLGEFEAICETAIDRAIRAMVEIVWRNKPRFENLVTLSLQTISIIENFKFSINIDVYLLKVFVSTWINLALFLKGQCHEIFDLWFFSPINPT